MEDQRVTKFAVLTAHILVKGEKKFVCQFVCASNQSGSSGDSATILQYTNVTGLVHPGTDPSWSHTPGGTVS